jgi:hypothetical protein
LVRIHPAIAHHLSHHRRGLWKFLDGRAELFGQSEAVEVII